MAMMVMTFARVLLSTLDVHLSLVHMLYIIDTCVCVFNVCTVACACV